MLIRNGHVDGALVDVRVDEGVITEIAPGLGASDKRGEGLDLEGAHIVPGLWDEHVHFGQWALNQQRLDVSAATSARETAALVGAAIAAAPRLVGYGFRDGLWPDAPNLADLDAIAPDRPVVLISGDLHAVWLNSAALAEHGHAGHPTGLLREEPAFEVTRRMAQVPADELDAAVIAAGREAAKRGVVGVVDLEMDWQLDVWRRRRAAGFDTQRVQFGIYRQHLDRAIELGLRTGQAIDELLTVGRFKILTDGSLNTRTAYCAHNYPGTDERGLLEVPLDELVGLVRHAWRNGIEPSIHAIGDAANTVALDAFAAVGCPGRIEHAQLVAAADFARFAALGVVASIQPEHAMDDRDVADHYWADRADRSYAWRSLLDAGGALALGSDAPVAPVDPWVTMSAAVYRARDGREAWHSEQRIPFAAALAGSTRSTVAVGQPADLVAVPTDPALADAEQLRGMPVLLTMLGGSVTFK